MADIIVEALGDEERRILDEWLDDAATANIAVTEISSIDRAYEEYVEHVLTLPKQERSDEVVSSDLAMLGFALGQWLTLNSILEWRVVTDAEGRDLGLSLPDETSIMFPSDFIADAWNEQRRNWLEAWALDLKNQLAALA